MSPACPLSSRVAAELADPAGRLGPDLAAHLPGCPACRTAAASAVRDWPLDRSPSESLLEWLTAATGTATLSEFQAEAVAAGRFGDLSLGPYLILDKLGAGGMGEVYRARHRFLQRVDAVKTVRPEIAAHPNAVKRFLREAEAAAKLRHPNVVHVYAADRAGAGYYIAMEYVPGADLGHLTRVRGPLPAAEACEYTRQAAEGLQHAFARGLVHRDVKPGNLLVTADGVTVKVADFGLARAFTPGTVGDEVTASGAILGTTDYMAPEQAEDARAADTRADVYSLGCTLYHLLTGRVPFPGGSLRDKLNRHATAGVPPLSAARTDVPPEVEAVVRKCLAKHPAERYQTPGELAEALRALAPSPAPVPAAATASAGRGPLPQTAEFEGGGDSAPGSGPGHTHPGAADETRRDDPPLPKRRSRVWAVAGLLAVAAATALALQFADRGQSDGAAKKGEENGPGGDDPKSAPAAGGWKPVGEFKSPRNDAVAVVGFGADGEVIGVREGGGPDAFDPNWIEVWAARGGDPLRAGQPKGLHEHARPCAVSTRGALVLYTDLKMFGTSDGFPAAKPLDPDLAKWQSGAKVESIFAAVFNSGSEARPADKYVLASADVAGPKGKHIRVVLWEVATNDRRSAPEIRTEVGNVPGVAVDRSGDHVAARAFDGGVHAWDMNVLSRTWPTSADRNGALVGVAMSPDGATVYAGHPEEKAVFAWDLKKNERGRRLECPSPPYPLIVSPNGRWLVGSGEGLRVWDLSADTPQPVTLSEKGWFRGVAFSPDSRKLAVGGYANIDDLRTGGAWVWELKP